MVMQLLGGEIHHRPVTRIPVPESGDLLTWRWVGKAPPWSCWRLPDLARTLLWNSAVL